MHVMVIDKNPLLRGIRSRYAALCNQRGNCPDVRCGRVDSFNEHGGYR